MPAGRMFRLRVTYVKAGRLAMLSHLEITHALERIVRRADLPFALSNGFSPHMRIAFGSALPVGIGSTCEIFDLHLEDYMAPAKALSALKSAAPSQLMPIACEYIEPRSKAASIAFPFSAYRAVFSSAIDRLEVPEIIEQVRKRKRKTLVVRDFLVGDPVVRGCKAVFQLQQGEGGNLRPDSFVEACIEMLPDGEFGLLSVERVEQSEFPIGEDDLSAHVR